jgi:hypothetical protein
VRICASAFCLLLLFPGFGFSENHDVRYQVTVDWEKGVLTLQMTVPVALDTAVFPQARGAAEKKIEEARGGFFIHALQEVRLDSSATVGEFLAATGRPDGRGAYLADLEELAGRGMKLHSVVSRDFRELSVTYAYAFYGPAGVITPLVVHDRPHPLPEMPGYYPTRPFTGLVIYARGTYQAFGKNTRVSCKPALHPRIFYLSERKTMEPVLDYEMVDPVVLKSTGMLSYVRSADPAAYVERAGDNPLTVTAYAIYGTEDTDIVIAEDAARRLLSSEANRRLLREGRVAVIID